MYNAFNNYNSPYINPVTTGYSYSNGFSQSRQEIIKVNGEAGARAYQLAPNSSILLLDESQPLVWLKVTDGAGYPTITPYKIEPYTPETSDTFATKANELETRIKRIEEIINESDNFNVTATKSKKYTQSDTAD